MVMKVSELIEALKTFPPEIDVEMEVYEEDGGSGYFSRSSTRSVRAELFAGPGSDQIVVISQKEPGTE